MKTVGDFIKALGGHRVQISHAACPKGVGLQPFLALNAMALEDYEAALSLANTVDCHLPMTAFIEHLATCKERICGAETVDHQALWNLRTALELAWEFL